MTRFRNKTSVEAGLTLAPREGETIAAAVRDRFGELDILVHTLGGSSTPAGGFAAATEDDWQRELAFNLFPAVRLDRALLPPMLDAGRGTVVHVSSIQRRLPLFDSTLGYAAAITGAEHTIDGGTIPTVG